VAASGPVAARVPTPALASAFRQSIRDFYFNSWRLAPANLAWAAGLIVVLVVAAASPPALILLGALGIPVAGIHRMTASIARHRGAAFSDFVDGMRGQAGPAFAVGFGSTVLAGIFAANVAIGLGLDNPFGWFLAASAAYAEVALAMVLVAIWPILADPERDALPFRRKLGLAGLVVIARPGPMLALTIGLVAILVAAIVILAGIALVGVAYAALVASRFVLPLADRLEGRVVDQLG